MTHEPNPIILPDSVDTNEPQTNTPPTAKEPTFKISSHPDHDEIFQQIRKNSYFPEGDLSLDLFLDRIWWMNEVFKLESNGFPTNLGVVRLLKFYKTILDEVTELVECVNSEDFVKHILGNDPFLIESDDPKYIENLVRDYEQNTGVKLEVNMVALADTLVDIAVYDFSEMVRWGIPAEECCNAVMESQVTKLDTDGKPLKSPDNAKFIKGPYFQPPEPMLKQILDEFSNEE